MNNKFRIYYKEGVFVLIKSIDKYDNCVYWNHFLIPASLYGGSVIVKHNEKDEDMAFLLVNGVEIININTMKEGEKELSKILHLSTIVQFLNAIEINGVEAFVQNYKESLEQLQVDLKDLKEEKESALPTLTEESLIEKVKKEIMNINNLLYCLIGLLFNCRLFITAGLENDKIIS
ncbi:MAG TPA: hypothetical protein GXZ90_05360, partial [Clostridiales bacterium]|nr:hypothetical protein [Clostridiales bacterium]